MPLIIPITASALAYRARLDIDGVEVLLDVEWRERSVAWWLKLMTSAGEVITGPRQIVLGEPIAPTGGNPRWPGGAIIPVRLDDLDLPIDLFDLGSVAQLQYWSAEEIAELAEDESDIARVEVAP